MMRLLELPTKILVEDEEIMSGESASKVYQIYSDVTNVLREDFEIELDDIGFDLKALGLLDQFDSKRKLIRSSLLRETYCKTILRLIHSKTTSKLNILI